MEEELGTLLPLYPTALQQSIVLKIDGYSEHVTRDRKRKEIQVFLKVNLKFVTAVDLVK